MFLTAIVATFPQFVLCPDFCYSILCTTWILNNEYSVRVEGIVPQFCCLLMKSHILLSIDEISYFDKWKWNIDHSLFYEFFSVLNFHTSLPSTMCKNHPFYYRMASLITVSSVSGHTYESVSTGGWYWNDVQHFWPATVPFAACPLLFQILAPVPFRDKTSHCSFCRNTNMFSLVFWKHVLKLSKSVK